MRNFLSGRRWRSKRAALLLVIGIATLALGSQSAGAFAEPRVEPPGGKTTYVVSQASLAADSRNNNVLLSTYVFGEDGKVSANGWRWSQSAPKARERTGTLPDDSCATSGNPGDSGDTVQKCYLLTAGGFTGDANDTRSGSYTVDGNVVGITWDGGDVTESWNLTASDDGTLVKMDLADGSVATHGFGYGSNAAATTRTDLADMPGHPEPLIQDMYSWAHDEVSQALDGTLTHDKFKACDDTAQCLTYLQPSSSNVCQQTSGCPNYGGGSQADVSSIQYYMQAITAKDRRDTFWHWCTCLAMERDEPCYTGNSHVKPMLQVIDDNGGFHGWVGVEASFYPEGNDPRGQDMLGTFRITDFS